MTWRTPELAPLFKLAHHSNRRTLSFERFNVYDLPLHGGTSVVPGLELMTHCPRGFDHNHQATYHNEEKIIVNKGRRRKRMRAFSSLEWVSE
ncbi:hypothetical protein TNCV_2339571 [Trichonephila clavipes]|nr:hypothetical protein TNCV_2339571 [Trichonephila clavipes]